MRNTCMTEILKLFKIMKWKNKDAPQIIIIDSKTFATIHTCSFKTHYSLLVYG